MGFVLARNMLHRGVSTSHRALIAAELATLKIGANGTPEGRPAGRAANMMGVSVKPVGHAALISTTKPIRWKQVSPLSIKMMTVFEQPYGLCI